MSANLSVVIPSRSPSKLAKCVAAVLMHDPDVRLIWVDDQDAPAEIMTATRILRIPGVKPFIFARNVNMGIVAAGNDDVIVLNDDALLESPRGFTKMQAEAERLPSIGIIGAVTNVTGQPLQHSRGFGLRIVPHFAFVCVLIPRRTINRVGLLDSRYAIDYGCEDRDYCEAVNRAALSCAVYDHCFVDHASLTSEYRGAPRAPRDFSRNKALFDQKWGPEAWNRQ